MRRSKFEQAVLTIFGNLFGDEPFSSGLKEEKLIARRGKENKFTRN